MNFKMKCAKCNKVYIVSFESCGKQGKCKVCGNIIKIPNQEFILQKRDEFLKRKIEEEKANNNEEKINEFAKDKSEINIQSIKKNYVKEKHFLLKKIIEKKFLLLLTIIPVCIFFIYFFGFRETKEIKDVKVFIKIGDWDNAIKKLENFIENNPRDKNAYKHLLNAKFNKICSEFDKDLFLDPYTSDLDSFPEIDKSGAEGLFTLIDRIEKLHISFKDDVPIYFAGLFNYYQWYNKDKIGTSMENLMKFKYEPVARKDSKDIAQASKYFKICSDINKSLADNASLWLFHINSYDSSFNYIKEINKFRKRYPNSELLVRLDMIEFSDTLSTLAWPIRKNLDYSGIEEIIQLCKKGLNSITKIDEVKESIIIDLIHTILAIHIESEKLHPDQIKSAVLLKYLTKLYSYNLFEDFNIEVQFGIGDVYTYTKNFSEAIKIYQDLNNKVIPEKYHDKLMEKFATAYYQKKDYSNAIIFYEKMNKPTEFNLLDMMECYISINQIDKARDISNTLKISKNPIIQRMAVDFYDLFLSFGVKIENKNVQVDDYSIKITGYVVNTLSITVYKVIVLGRITDSNGNNAKLSYDYIDLIYPARKSYYELSFYYGEDVPSSFKYNVHVEKFSEK